jgi:hypothetical protein
VVCELLGDVVGEDTTVEPSTAMLVVDVGAVVVVVGAVVVVVGPEVVVVGPDVVVVVGVVVVVVVGAVVVVAGIVVVVVVVVVVGAAVVVVAGTVVVVVGAAVVVDVVVGAAVVVVVDEVVGVVVVVDAVVEVVVGAAVVDVVVVVVAVDEQTWVTLNVDVSLPPSIWAVALKMVSVSGASTTANFEFAATVPEMVPLFWNVALIDTKAEPCESGSTNTQPVPCEQSCGYDVPTVPIWPGLSVAVDVAEAAGAKKSTDAASAAVNATAPASNRARRRPRPCTILDSSRPPGMIPQLCRSYPRGSTRGPGSDALSAV